MGADAIAFKVLDHVNCDVVEVYGSYKDGSHFNYEELGIESVVNLIKPIDEVAISFGGDSTPDVVVVEISYLKNAKKVGSALLPIGNCELKLLKYKVELPRGAKVTLFDDAAMEAKFLAWNLPCPTTLPNMTFLQVKAANGFEQQLTPSAGSQAIELYTELGRRYAVFGEIWTYSFAQTLWFADLKVQLSNYEWQDCVPTAGEGGTIVTALPQ